MYVARNEKKNPCLTFLSLICTKPEISHLDNSIDLFSTRWNRAHVVYSPPMANTDELILTLHEASPNSGRDRKLQKFSMNVNEQACEVETPGPFLEGGCSRTQWPI